MYSAFCVFLVLGPILITGQYVESPCPNIFEYKNDGGGIYGLIHLRSTGPVSSVFIRANFTIAARLLTVSVSKTRETLNCA